MWPLIVAMGPTLATTIAIWLENIFARYRKRHLETKTLMPYLKNHMLKNTNPWWLSGNLSPESRFSFLLFFFFSDSSGFLLVCASSSTGCLGRRKTTGPVRPGVLARPGCLSPSLSPSRDLRAQPTGTNRFPGPARRSSAALHCTSSTHIWHISRIFGVVSTAPATFTRKRVALVTLVLVQVDPSGRVSKL